MSTDSKLSVMPFLFFFSCKAEVSSEKIISALSYFNSLFAMTMLKRSKMSQADKPPNPQAHTEHTIRNFM